MLEVLVDCGFLSNQRGPGMAWVLSPWASWTFIVQLGSTESPAVQLVYKAPVLAAVYQGWNLPISILSVVCLRGLCHNPFTPPRRKAPLSSCSSNSLTDVFSGLHAQGSYLLMCETQSLTHPYHRKVGPSRVEGEHHFLGKKVLSELEWDIVSPSPSLSSLVAGIGFLRLLQSFSA